jgi:hypothetical protein
MRFELTRMRIVPLRAPPIVAPRAGQCGTYKGKDHYPRQDSGKIVDDQMDVVPDIIPPELRRQEECQDGQDAGDDCASRRPSCNPC